MSHLGPVPKAARGNAYVVLERLTHALYELHLHGKGETSEANAIPILMEILWSALSEEERRKLVALSSSLCAGRNQYTASEST